MRSYTSYVGVAPDISVTGFHETVSDVVVVPATFTPVGIAGLGIVSVTVPLALVKFGSAKVPTAIPISPGNASKRPNTAQPHDGQKLDSCQRPEAVERR